MCSDFDKVSPSSMSSSDMFLVKEHEEEIGYCILKEDSFEYREVFDVTVVSQDPDTLQNHYQQKAKDGNSEEEQECRKQDSSMESKRELPSLGELRESSVLVNDDDDGFKTPTSLDHKIPVATECPPAPRKSMSHFSMKRKASSPTARRNLHFVDLPQDLESLFRLPILSDIKKKLKKARTDE